jgi:hypothetical protein
MSRRGLLLLAPLLLAACHAGHTSQPSSPQPTGEVAVGRTVTDPVAGDALTVQDVDRHGSERLVEVSAAAGTRFGTSVTPARVTVLTAAGVVVAAATPPAGFPPFVGAEPGRRAAGWLAFTTPRAAGSMLQLDRAALTVVGSQQTVPAATYAVALPTI